MKIVGDSTWMATCTYLHISVHRTAMMYTGITGTRADRLGGRVVEEGYTSCNLHG